MRLGGRAARFVRGDAASEVVLARANVREARAAIVVAGTSRAAANASGERGILVTLTLKSVKPELHVTVEALDDKSEPHLRRAGAGDIIISGECNGFPLSSAAVAPGISRVARPLLSLSGTELRRVTVPSDLVGKTSGEVGGALRAPGTASRRPPSSTRTAGSRWKSCCRTTARWSIASSGSSSARPVASSCATRPAVRRRS
ncbi:MAG TPA: NAD-binding protein [Candidatus Limnocylindria bacterium]|nr:NAD-binding protein [Candidatus Limnocylindria bacterium]